TMCIALPVGVMTAVYLEEFAPDNRITQIIEVNINNLAAIPSILFGLLGLAIFINFFGVPRSSAIAGGLTLALMTLPIIIITTRAALRAVPSTIREAAYGLGASRWQTVWHHVLPLAFPGILTGSIIGLAQAMGETAPLLIVGMMAYIPDTPTSFTEAATVLPAQIFTWAGESIRAYEERTAAAILVLLSILLSMNSFAVWLRKRFEVRW
ncbi:MAG: phosphate ABC transporter permease PstA, partial [Ghiorsea sp.]